MQALRTMVVAGGVLAASMAYSPAVQAADYWLNWTPYAKISHMSWKEFNQGLKTPTENGYLYSFGVAGRYTPSRDYDVFSSRLVFRPKVELFLGTTDYEALDAGNQPTDGNTVRKTDDDIFGWKAETTMGYRAVRERTYFVEPFVGIGYTTFSKDIKTAVNVGGAEQEWTSLYAKAGAAVEYNMTEYEGYTQKLYLTAGATYPFDNEMTLSGDSRYGTATVSPGTALAPYFEVGMKFNRFQVGVSYEQQKYDASESVATGQAAPYDTFRQPEAEANIFGLAIGFIF